MNFRSLVFLIRPMQLRTLQRQLCTSQFTNSICNRTPLLDSNKIVATTFSSSFVRGYAKGKNKVKEKGKTQVKFSEAEIVDFVNVDSIKKQMQRSVDSMKDEFIKHVTLRAGAAYLHMVKVNFDGKDYLLEELAQIIKKNPKTIVINMSVFPQAIPAAIKAIQSSGLNLNPQQDGTVLYIPIPKVTKEHRENLAKNAKKIFIKYRDNIKDVQNKQIKSIKKKKEISEDKVRVIEQQVIALADTYIVEAEKLLQNKQNELLGEKE